MAMNYSLTFKNQSANTSSIIIYQVDPNLSSGEFSLVWQSAKWVPPQALVCFTWKLDYGFVWGEMEKLEPGEVFSAIETAPADLSATNAITLDSQADNLQFSNQGPGPVPGSLLIANSANIPMKAVAEGISMSGKGTFVVGAQPNMEVLFEPEPEYWIAFGNFVQGEVLHSDLMAQTNTLKTKQIYGLPTRVQFPASVFEMTATLNTNNSWTIEPS